MTLTQDNDVCKITVNNETLKVIKTKTKSSKFSVSIRSGLRQVKRPSSNPKSECDFWLNTNVIEGNFKYKKWRTNSCESILRFSDPNLRKFELYGKHRISSKRDK